ncbi:hypothetical protein Tco_0392347 [Tanacetum coccineum]
MNTIPSMSEVVSRGDVDLVNIIKKSIEELSLRYGLLLSFNKSTLVFGGLKEVEEGDHALIQDNHSWVKSMKYSNLTHDYEWIAPYTPRIHAVVERLSWFASNRKLFILFATKDISSLLVESDDEGVVEISEPIIPPVSPCL